MARHDRSSLRLVLLSDTHEIHREADIPSGDVLIHAGDWTQFSRSLRAIEDFNDWLGELPHRVKICVPGNHETFLEADPARVFLVDCATVLINQAITIEGLRIWGSPVTPLPGAAFGLASASDRRRLYSRVPLATDILVTHGPPYGILDSTLGDRTSSGCKELLDAVLRLKPKLHIFGHVHGAFGMVQTTDTTFINVALMGTYGGLENAPVVVDIAQL